MVAGMDQILLVAPSPHSSSTTGYETVEAGHRGSNRKSAEVIFTHWVELGAL